MDWNLLKCGFGYHNYGIKLHDDMLDKWVMICRICGESVTVEAPLNENGEAEDPHEWLMKHDIYEE